MKPRILLVNEAGYLSTGYSNYGREVFKRLHALNCFELAELSIYGHPLDVRAQSLPWRTYGNAPTNQQEEQAYMANPANTFGKWRFEDTLLHFKPHLVISINDPWMCLWQQTSPLRRRFKIAWLCPVDAVPQEDSWLLGYSKADFLLTYTDWGKKVLEKHGLKVRSSAAGLDINTFSPVSNKAQTKASMGINPNSFVIGTVMRNQKRKLFPNLFKDFAKLCEAIGNQHNLYLYCHTAYPDVGWNIPRLLKDNNIADKVLFTHMCTKCHAVFAGLWRGEKSQCVSCGEDSVIHPTPQQSIDDKTLATIMNLFDLYVQYAVCLGKDEEILTDKGWNKISTVKEGDLAWTHKNRWRKITKVWKNLSISRDVPKKTISVYGDYETLTLTQDHEVLALTKNEIKTGRSVREKIGHKLYHNQTLPEFKKYEVSQLTAGDVLCIPIDDFTQDIEKIDINNFNINPNYAVSDNTIYFQKYTYNRYITIDEEFCKFLGLFVADGSTGSKTGITVTSHIKEAENHNLCISVMKKMVRANPNISEYKYKNRQGITHTLNSRLHNALFKMWCKSKTEKCFPDWVLNLPVNKQIQLLAGLMMGDGCYVKEKNITVFATISKKLADQVKHLLRRLRINFGASKRNKSGNRKPQYHFEIVGNIKNAEIITERYKTASVYYQKYHILPIKKIDDSDYNDAVWCITVEDDHTMTTKIGAVFQCEGLGIPQIEAASCGVPVATVAYSGMQDIIDKLHAIKIDVGHYERESETHREFAYPSSESFVNNIQQFLQLPEPIRLKKGHKTRENVLKYFDWDKVATVWADVCHQINVEESEKLWQLPPDISQTTQYNAPENLSNYDFVAWLYNEVLRRPQDFYAYPAAEMIDSLNNGSRLPHFGGPYITDMSILGGQPRWEPYDRQRAGNEILQQRNEINYWEAVLAGYEKRPVPEFIRVFKPGT